MFGKILEIIVGIIWVLWDIVSGVFKYARDGTIIIFQNSSDRKKNIIYRHLTGYNPFVDLPIVAVIFLSVAQYSALLGIIVTIIFLFWFHGVKNSDISDDAYIFTIFGSIALVVGSIIYTNVYTAYDYKEVGNITLTKEDIQYDYSDKAGDMQTFYNKDIEINLGGELVDVYIKGCKPGTFKVYEESLKGGPVKFLKTDYVAECSTYMSKYKKLEEK